MIPHPTALEAAGIPARTARRWHAERRIPEPWRRWLDLTLHGELGEAFPGWRGWKLTEAALWSPDGWSFSRGELVALPFEYQRVAALEAELRRVAALAPGAGAGRVGADGSTAFSFPLGR